MLTRVQIQEPPRYPREKRKPSDLSATNRSTGTGHLEPAPGLVSRLAKTEAAARQLK